jgi:hypothetical protein
MEIILRHDAGFVVSFLLVHVSRRLCRITTRRRRESARHEEFCAFLCLFVATEIRILRGAQAERDRSAASAHECFVFSDSKKEMKGPQGRRGRWASHLGIINLVRRFLPPFLSARCLRLQDFLWGRRGIAAEPWRRLLDGAARLRSPSSAGAPLEPHPRTFQWTEEQILGSKSSEIFGHSQD